MGIVESKEGGPVVVLRVGCRVGSGVGSKVGAGVGACVRSTVWVGGSGIDT